MSSPLVKIVWINATPFKDNQQLLQDVLKAGSRDDVCLHLFKGLSVEKPDLGAWVTTWTSQAEHDAVLAIPDHPARQYQSTVFADVGKEGGPTMTIATLDDSLDALHKALAAPVTEVTEVRLKDGASISELEARLLKGTQSLAAAAGAHAVVRAKKVNDSNVYVIIAGWDSVDAHMKAKEPGTEVSTNLKSLAEVISPVYIRHVPLTLFK